MEGVGVDIGVHVKGQPTICISSHAEHHSRECIEEGRGAHWRWLGDAAEGSGGGV